MCKWYYSQHDHADPEYFKAVVSPIEYYWSRTIEINGICEHSRMVPYGL